MTTTVATIAAAVLGSVGAYYTWKSSSSRQRQLAKDEVASENAAKEAKKAEIREAVYQNDDEKLNQIVNQLMKD